MRWKKNEMKKLLFKIRFLPKHTDFIFIFCLSIEIAAAIIINEYDDDDDHHHDDFIH
jgi:hypothetical protein